MLLNLHPQQLAESKLQAHPLRRLQASCVAHNHFHYACVPDQSGIRQISLLEVREEITDALCQVGNGFAIWCAVAKRIGGPSIQRRATDGLPGLHFPIAEVHFLQARVDDRFRMQRFGDKTAALQRAGEDWNAVGQLGPESIGCVACRVRQRKVAATVTDAGCDLGLRVADQVKLHSMPR